MKQIRAPVLLSTGFKVKYNNKNKKKNESNKN
jgi:hypothetical protein